MTLDTFSHVNYLAVLVAAVAYFAIGGLWYSPALFARPWMAASGVRPPEGRPPTGPLVLSFVIGFVISLVLAFLARATGSSDVGDGILLGLLIGIGIATALFVLSYTFENRSRALVWISSGYHVVAMVVAGIIVTVWD